MSARMHRPAFDTLGARRVLAVFADGSWSRSWDWWGLDWDRYVLLLEGVERVRVETASKYLLWKDPTVWELYINSDRRDASSRPP